MMLDSLDTPAALVDIARLKRNIDAMQRRMNALGVRFRPHVKTSKCLDVVQAQCRAGAQGITVSTLKEAEAFFAAGITDILYAVSVVPSKLPRAMALIEKGCRLKLVVDNVNAAAGIVAFRQTAAEPLEVWIEVDTDGHRSGITPEAATLLEVGRTLAAGGVTVGGVLTHAGSSYDLNTPEALTALAEQERAGCVRAAQRLREAGVPCENVSVGSTPTALMATHLAGVTEVRAGVYAFFDLVMHNVGVCAIDDIALSVLTTVIGHQPEKGWVIVDAGWMAMSRDRGTAKQARDFGYGLPVSSDGTVMDGYALIAANQEHGIVARTGGVGAEAGAGSSEDLERRFPIGSKLRILPNHACATGAQFPAYHAVDANGEVATWGRFHGW
ncbi:DSD1 family PLP-dependent enzyme [Chitinasiproducens palmae]|uniref:D-serine deaminase, pyridoxal phosphate-dependent n=1 Tax=Chitinasiproducens palmae TaxID=1770053 RepID=A0A1H2PU06_9BURK|nr:DSD1 family PLP-dependent enzyme [Chitinasiproducens palmae]SDV50631.1 D-serine deaminase, pyridoxal phosphate-dependent [Chitinasiproducens palmae]